MTPEEIRDSNKIYFDFANLEDLDTDESAINNSIRNILLTRRGSLPGKPTFGSDLYRVIFEHIDHVTEDLIRTYVINALIIWEPRISITRVSVDEYPEYNKIVIHIEYYYIYYDSQRDSSVNITIFRQ